MASQILFTSLNEAELKNLICNTVSSELQKHFNVMLPNQENNRYYSRKEVAEILKVTPKTLISYTKQGRIKSHRIGRRILYKQSDIESSLQFMNSKFIK